MLSYAILLDLAKSLEVAREGDDGVKNANFCKAIKKLKAVCRFKVD